MQDLTDYNLGDIVDLTIDNCNILTIVEDLEYGLDRKPHIIDLRIISSFCNDWKVKSVLRLPLVFDGEKPLKFLVKDPDKLHVNKEIRREGIIKII